MESRPDLQKRASTIVTLLAKAYPDSGCKLTHVNAFQLLIKTILSAQCTDVRVNEVSEMLFRKYHGPEDFLRIPASELENDIRPTGFFRNKARNIQACCESLIRNHDGQIPDTMDELILLPGVGRKTANVILGNFYGKPALAVDTHVIRISRLLRFTRHHDAVKIERDLMKILPEKEWTMFCHRIQDHGRAVCIARRPKCAECTLAKLCPSAQ